MPIYEYACEKCKSEFEVEQRITDAPVKTCPYCKSKKIKRLISRTSFVLKGGGWYSDLYSSSGAKNEKADKPDAGDGATASAPDDAKSTPKSEAKTADASKTKDTPSAKAKSKSKGSKAAKR